MPKTRPKRGINNDVDPHAVFVEQPMSTMDSRKYTNITGMNTTPTLRTYPKIKICNYIGPCVIIVSCVTKLQPHRPHPNNLVGDKCMNGFASVRFIVAPANDTFELRVGIRRVRTAEIAQSIAMRRQKNVDLYLTGFDENFKFNMNSVRLAVQVILRKCRADGTIENVPLNPIVSEPINDNNLGNDLTIFNISQCFCSMNGLKKLMLFCETVERADIEVRFFEQKNGEVVWRAKAGVIPTNVHRRTAIVFYSPPYYKPNTEHSVDVLIELYRPSDGATSAPIPFTYIPLTFDCFKPNSMKRKRSKIEQSQELRDYLATYESKEPDATKELVDNVARRRKVAIPLNIPLDNQAGISLPNLVNDQPTVTTCAISSSYTGSVNSSVSSAGSSCAFTTVLENSAFQTTEDSLQTKEITNNTISINILGKNFNYRIPTKMDNDQNDNLNYYEKPQIKDSYKHPLYIQECGELSQIGQLETHCITNSKHILQENQQQPVSEPTQTLKPKSNQKSQPIAHRKSITKTPQPLQKSNDQQLQILDEELQPFLKLQPPLQPQHQLLGAEMENKQNHQSSQQQLLLQKEHDLLEQELEQYIQQLQIESQKTNNLPHISIDELLLGNMEVEHPMHQQTIPLKSDADTAGDFHEMTHNLSSLSIEL